MRKTVSISGKRDNYNANQDTQYFANFSDFFASKKSTEFRVKMVIFFCKW